MALGVTALSWAHWVARALDLPFESYASSGALTADVLRDQVPRVRPGRELACVYVGVNDVRGGAWDPIAYERDLAAILAALASRARRLVVLTLPHDLGRPRAAPRPAAAGAIVRAVATAHGARVGDLSDLRGWTLLLPDAVHPTALGQLEIADRAAHALGATVLPSALAGVRRSPRDLARYAPVHGRMLARDLVRRGYERLAQDRVKAH